MLLRERRPASHAAMHARTFALPREQQARKLAGRCAARVECAVQVEPVGREDVKIMVLAVVLDARQIDEEALRVAVVAWIGAELREHGVVDEGGVPQVAVEEGEGRDALRVREHRCIQDDLPLVLGPTLDVLAADDVHDALVGVEDHVVRRMITITCEDSGKRQMSTSRAH